MPPSLCAPPSFERPSSRSLSTQLPPRAMQEPRWPCPSNETASSSRDFVLHPDGTLHCPGFAGALCDRTAQRRRWKPAPGLCRSHQSVSSLSFERAVPVAWQADHKTAPGQCSAASTPGGNCSAALEGLESQTASPSLHAAAPEASGAGGPTQPAHPRHVAADPFPRPTRPLPALVGRAIGPQCTRANGAPTHHHPVRRP